MFNAENFIGKWCWFICSHFVAIYSLNAGRSQKSQKITIIPYFEASASFKLLDANTPEKRVRSACVLLHVQTACLYLSATVLTLDEPIAIK